MVTLSNLWRTKLG